MTILSNVASREYDASSRSVFTPAQQNMLRMMSFVKTQHVLHELENVISDYFMTKADEEMDALWEAGAVNEATIKQWGEEHYRKTAKG